MRDAPTPSALGSKEAASALLGRQQSLKTRLRSKWAGARRAAGWRGSAGEDREPASGHDACRATEAAGRRRKASSARLGDNMVEK